MKIGGSMIEGINTVENWLKKLGSKGIDLYSIEKWTEQFYETKGRKNDYIASIMTIFARRLGDDLIDKDIDDIKNRIPDPEYGIIKPKVKTSYFGEYYINIGKDRGFDTLLVIGLSRKRKIVESAFAIPNIQLDGRRSISIVKNSRYEKFRVDEKPYNEVFHMIYKNMTKRSIPKPI